MLKSLLAKATTSEEQCEGKTLPSKNAAGENTANEKHCYRKTPLVIKTASEKTLLAQNLLKKSLDIAKHC